MLGMLQLKEREGVILRYFYALTVSCVMDVMSGGEEWECGRRGAVRRVKYNPIAD